MQGKFFAVLFAAAAQVAYGALSLVCLFYCGVAKADWMWTPQSALWFDTNWNNGASWSDGNAAIFGSASYTDVTIGGAVAPLDISVNGADYSFLGSGSITMTNGIFSVGDGYTATVFCNVSQPNNSSATRVDRFRKTGGGTLVLKGATSVDRYLQTDGTTVVDGGTFTITSSLADSTAQENLPVIFTGGRFIVDGGATVKFKGNYMMNAGGELMVTNGLLDFTGIGKEWLNAFNGRKIDADSRLGSVANGMASVLTVQDAGIVSGTTFRVSQTATGSGSVNLNAGGILALGRFKSDGLWYIGAINFNGGWLVRPNTWSGNIFHYDGTDATRWDNISVDILAGGLYYTDGGMGTVFNRPLLCGTDGVDGGVCITSTGDSVISLACSNTYTGVTKVDKGRIAIKYGRSLGADPIVPSTNFWFLGESGYLCSMADAGVVDVHSNRLFAVADGGEARFAAATNSKLVVHGLVECPASRLLVAGNTDWYSGVIAFDPGENRTNDVLKMAVEGVAEICSGTFVLRNTAVGSTTSASLYVNNDSATAFTNLATLRVTGGMLMPVGGRVQISKYGQLEVSNATVDLTSCDSLFNGHGSPGRITVGNGGVLDLPSTFRLTQCRTVGTEVNIKTGGVMKLSKYIVDVGQKYPFHANLNFDGGTVQTKGGGQVDFFGPASEYYTNIHVRVMGGGAIFDTGEYTTRIKTALERGDGADGGFVKKGAGYLILQRSCSSVGKTEILEGILRLAALNGTLDPSSTIVVNTNAVCELWTDIFYDESRGYVNETAYATQTVARIEGCGRIKDGYFLSVTNSLAPGMGAGGIGTLTLHRTCRLSGVLEIDANAERADCLAVENGSLDISGLSLCANLPENPEVLGGEERYTIVSAPGGITGKFSETNLGGRWYVRYTPTSAELRYRRGMIISVW